MALARRSPPLTRRAATPAARRARGPRRRAAARAAADNDSNNTSNNDVSDAFSRELRRRGVGSSEGDESREAFLERPSEEEPAERDERMFGQLERTRQMQVRVRWRRHALLGASRAETLGMLRSCTVRALCVSRAPEDLGGARKSGCNFVVRPKCVTLYVMRMQSVCELRGARRGWR